MKSKVILIVVLSIYSLIMVFGIIDANKNKEQDTVNIEIEYTDLALQWACFDGCFNMLETEHGHIDFDNEDMEALHFYCCMMCSCQYGDDECMVVNASMGSFGIIPPELAPTYMETDGTYYIKGNKEEEEL